MLTTKLIIISMLISFLSAQYVLKGGDPNGIESFSNIKLSKEKNFDDIECGKWEIFYINRENLPVGICRNRESSRLFYVIDLLNDDKSHLKKSSFLVNDGRWVKSKLHHLSKYGSDFIAFMYYDEDDKRNNLAIMKDENFKERRSIDLNGSINKFEILNGMIFIYTNDDDVCVYEILEDFGLSQKSKFKNPIRYQKFQYYNFNGHDYYYETEYFEKQQFTKIFTLKDDVMKEVKHLKSEGNPVMYLNGSLYFYKNKSLTKVDLREKDAPKAIELNFKHIESLNDNSFMTYKEGVFSIYSYDLTLIKTYEDLVERWDFYIFTQKHYIEIYSSKNSFRRKIYDLKRGFFANWKKIK